MSKFARFSPLALLAIAPLSQAAVPPDVTTAITGAGTDAAVVGAAVLVVLVGIAAFKWLRRAM